MSVIADGSVALLNPSVLLRRGVSISGGSTPAPATFESLMLSLPGLIAWYPQNESSGTTADNAGGTVARDGTYAGSFLLQGATFPNGDLVASYPGNNDYMNFGTASVAASWDWNNCWFILWALPDATEQAGTLQKKWLYITGTVSTYINVEHSPSGAYLIALDHRPNGDSVNRLYWADWIVSPNYTMLAAQLSGGTGYFWRNGILVSTKTGITQATDAMNTSGANRIGTWFPTFHNAKGSWPHFAIGSGGAITTELANSVYEKVYPSAKNLFITGDSHATDNDYWIAKLTGNLETSGSEVWRECPYRLGYSGQRVLYWNTQLVTDLASITGTPDKIGINICANDITAGTAEDTVKTNLTGGIDKLLAKWPSASIYVAQPYRDDAYNGAYDSYCLNLKQWILDVIATYASNVFAGPDENTWFKGANIDTYSADRIHPTTTAGHTECAAQWATAMGY